MRRIAVFERDRIVRRPTAEILGRVLSEKPAQARLCFRVSFQLEQRSQFAEYQRSIEAGVLTHENSFDVQPVLHAPGKRLQDNKVLG